ncbi:MAG: serine hydrolase [Microscillaceae bacterium]|nr:serine hydrolase [Microscillaceae bacterium]
MKKIFFAVAILLLYVIQINAQSKSERINQVENGLIPYVPVKGFKSWNLAERMKYYGVQGVSIAVIKDFKIDWAKAYGWADTAKHIRVNTETMFSAGSISKLLMASAALKMVQAKKIDLEKPINSYLKSWQLPENDLTRKKAVNLRMLLSHTAGTSQSAYFGYFPTKKPLPNVVDILSGAPIAECRGVAVVKEPETGFQYSGGGSMVAQMALMDVSGLSFEELMQKTIFKPLSMKNSTFTQPIDNQYINKTSWGYSAATWYQGMPYIYPQQAAAGLYSTPSDIANFLIDLQKSYRNQGKVLNQAMMQTMVKPQATVSEGYYREEIGVGPFLFQKTQNKSEKGIYFTFDGVNAGFTAFAMANLTEGYGVVIMLNSGDDFNALGKEIRRAVAKVYNWYEFLPEEITPIKLDEKTLASYEGRYRMSADEVVYIQKEQNYLVERINQGKEIYCFPIAQDSIVFTDYNIKGKFVRNEKGEVIGLQNIYQKEPMRKMKPDESTPSELLNAQRYEEAKEVIKNLNLNEYQLTYLAYEKSKDLRAARAILEVALAQFPQSAIVYARWGDLYYLLNDKINALKNYEIALSLQPNDESLQAKIKELRK